MTTIKEGVDDDASGGPLPLAEGGDSAALTAVNPELRDGDDGDSMIGAFRQGAASGVEDVLERNENPLKAVEADPRLTFLREQFEGLDAKYRTFDGKVRSFEEVLKAVPNVDNLLTEMDTLEQGQVYFLSKEGKLILGDGCEEPFQETLWRNYSELRSEATRVSYVDDKGEIITIEGDDTEIPEGVKVVSERGLITLDEYELVNRGQFEKEKAVWVERGKNPSVVCDALWADGAVLTREYGLDADPDGEARGSRRVVRVNLNFES